jgi:hypothetical protein
VWHYQTSDGCAGFVQGGGGRFSPIDRYPFTGYPEAAGNIEQDLGGETSIHNEVDLLAV